MAPFPSFTGPPAEPQTIRIPTFRSPTAKTQPARVPQNRDEARAARLKTSGEGQWASLDALASAGPSSLAHLLAKRDPSTSRPIASSSSSRPKPAPEPTKKVVPARKSPRKSGARGDVARTTDAVGEFSIGIDQLAGPSKPTKQIPRASDFPKNSAPTTTATAAEPPSPVDNPLAQFPPPPSAASTSAPAKKPRKSSANSKKDALKAAAEEEEGGPAKGKKPVKRKSAAAGAVDDDDERAEGEKSVKKRRASVKGKAKAKEAEPELDEGKKAEHEPSDAPVNKPRRSSTKYTNTTLPTVPKAQKEPRRRRSTRVAEPAVIFPPPPSPPVSVAAETPSASSGKGRKRARKVSVQADEQEEVELEERKRKQARRSAAEPAPKARVGKGKLQGKEKVAVGEKGGAEDSTRRSNGTAAAPARRIPVPSAASASTSRKQPTARQPRSPALDTFSSDEADTGERGKRKGAKVRTERLKGNEGKLNVFDVIAGGTRRALDQLIDEHGENPRMLKLLQRFASNVQSSLLSRSALLSTLTSQTRTLTSARTKSKKLRLELVETQRTRREVEREMRGREGEWEREESEAESLTSTHDFLAKLGAASTGWR
ncbi:hypothetical protein Rt10032_c14g5224 [Rhodotorula toruloides]|uniref:Uncharacterized protein n=1 Tax=Rhodotorula toruloides TaxID=5286 RepID=A0A511KLG4_RHOTO|nr:hypothetical protein Rt10032_c14g5224 [Rhodotorula toruloides]